MRYSRRDMVKLSLAALVPAAGRQDPQAAGGPQADSLVGRLPQPGLAGRPRAPVTDYENDPFIISVEERLRCTCGCNLDVYTCRTTDFTCQTSPAMHREVIALVQQDMTAQEILDAFVAQYGEVVLMAPKKEGFNLVGYVLPGTVIAVVGSAMLWILIRRERQPAAVPETVEPTGAAAVSGLSPEEEAKLEAELQELER